ncbi:hypothetical protein TNCV_4949031 [Trichonephila clavipes]|nr:hypothetical protein TNCV_4949031 [Trichonephila clavipes]
MVLSSTQLGDDGNHVVTVGSSSQSVHPIVIISIHGGPLGMKTGNVMQEVTMIRPIKLPQRREHIGV